MLAMLITELPGCMTRPQACATQYAPLRLTSITERNCSGVSRVAGCAVPTPALLINTSTRPKVCIAASTSAWHCLGSLTSVAMVSALRPLASTRDAVSDNLSTRRAPNTTSAPASANAWANDTPSPDEAPVTITTLSSSRNESSTPMRKTPLLSSLRSAEAMKLPLGNVPADQRPAGSGNPTSICPIERRKIRLSEQSCVVKIKTLRHFWLNSAGTQAGGNGMSGSHRRKSRGSLRLLSLLAATGLALATAPAHASPLTPPAPRDAQAAAAAVGPQIVDIDAKLGFQSAIGAGTGIVIDPSVVLTNNHVIAGATDLTARSIANGQTYPATVIGFDRQHDIAVLQLAGGGLPVANIGNSDTVKVGDPVVSLGNAGGAGGAPSVEEGRIGALGQTVSANDALTGSTETLNGLIQVDANIRPGDSGGPTVNAANQVIAMNTAATANFHLGRGQGFAIPINEAMAIAGQIRSGGRWAPGHPAARPPPPR